ncbi:MAG: hypothetical protein R2751_01260 [Bacteroidales bacterium]
MKFNLLTIAILLAGLTHLSGQGVSINEDGSSPDASALLDVSGTDKGVLIPRLTTAQMGAIATPATGLLVYNTDSASVFYYDGGWNRVANTYKIGFGSDYAHFEEDGTLFFEGEATVFNDLMIPGLSTVRNLNPPSLSTFLNGTLVYSFADEGSNSNEEQVYFTVQVAHMWKEGSTLYPHVHFAPATSGTGTIRWGLEYTWANVNATFPATTTIYAEASASGTAHQHQVIGFSTDLTPDANQDEISSMLVCRLFRDSSVDTYTGDVLFLQFDIHMEMNSEGSREPWIK